MRPDTRLLVQLCIGVWVCISNGAIFIFGIFSPQLRLEPFSLSQSDVNIIATVGAVASYLSLPVGILYDGAGPRAVMLVGALVSLVGWMGIAYVLWSVSYAVSHEGPSAALMASAYDSVSGSSTSDAAGAESYRTFREGALGAGADSSAVINLSLGPWLSWAPPFYILCFFYSLSQLSSPFFEQGTVLTNLQALSTHKGDVVLIQKTFMGLGSSIIAQVYSAYFLASSSSSSVAPTTNSSDLSPAEAEAFVEARHEMGGFCLFIALLSSVAGVVGGFFSRVPVKTTTTAETALGGDDNTDGHYFDNGAPLHIIGAGGTAPTAGGGARVMHVSARLRRWARFAFGTRNCPRVRGLNDNNEDGANIGRARGDGNATDSHFDGSQNQFPPLSSSDHHHPQSMERATTAVANNDAPKKSDASGNSSSGYVDEYTVADVFYGPFFYMARLLTLLIIAIVTVITFVNNYWVDIVGGSSASSEDAFISWQRSTVSIVLALCGFGFISLVVLFGPTRSFDQEMALLGKQRVKTGGSNFEAGVTVTCVVPPEGPASHSEDGEGRIDPATGNHQRREGADASTREADNNEEKKNERKRGRRRRHRGHSYQMVVRSVDSDNVSTDFPTNAAPCVPITALEKNEKSLWQNLTTDRQHLFALLAFRSLVVMGVTTTVSANSSQIYYALAPDVYSDTSNAAMVSVFGVASALGRVAAGMLDRAMQRALAVTADISTGSDGDYDAGKQKRITVGDSTRNGGRRGGNNGSSGYGGCVARPASVSSSASPASRGGEGGISPRMGNGPAVLGASPQLTHRTVSPRGGGGSVSVPIANDSHQRGEGVVVVAGSSPSTLGGSDTVLLPGPSCRNGECQSEEGDHYSEEGDDNQNPIGPSHHRPRTYLKTESIAHDYAPCLFHRLGLGEYGKVSSMNDDGSSSTSAALNCCCCRCPRILRTFANGLRRGLTGVPSASQGSGGGGWNVLHLSLIPHLSLLLAFPLFFFIPANFLIIPFALVGFATGTLWGGLILAVSHLFSGRFIGGHYGALSFTGMVTPVLFNVVLFGRTYDDVLIARGKPLSDRCDGLSCVLTPLLWCTGVNIAGTVVCVVLCRWASQRGGM